MNTNRDIVQEIYKATQICITCKQEKELDKFYTISGKDKKEGACIECRRLRGDQRYRELHPIPKPILDHSWTLKVCNVCEIEKHKDDFALNKGKFRDTTCKECRYVMRIKRQETWSEKKKRDIRKRREATKRAKDWYNNNNGANKERVRDTGYKYRYGISLEEYNVLLEEQGGVCAICLKPETTLFKGKVRKLAVDHNHKNGKVRGLLCGKCNKMLGLASDDSHLLLKAMGYLNNGYYN